MLKPFLSRMLLLFLVPALSLAPTLPGHAAAPIVPAPSPAALTAQLLATANVPRNLDVLGARLKLHTTTPINPVVNPTPTDYPIGRVDTFTALTDSGTAQIPAALAYKTAHAYFYVQKGVRVSLQALARSAATFEQQIYPTDVAAFGPLWLPGVDNDQHVTIFNGLLQTSGEAGYVYAEDQVPRTIYPFSNQRKILFLDIGLAQPGTPAYDSNLAHEFQHVLHAHLHPMDDAWVNEGSSVLAQVLNGYSDDGWAAALAIQPASQLTAWGGTNIYGAGYLWMLYFYEHFGGDRATRMELADSDLDGLPLFDDLLRKLGYHESSTQLFSDWVVANFLNDRSIAGGRYGYRLTNAHASPTSTHTVPFSQTSTMPQYAANYIDIPRTGSAPFTLTFSGNPTVPLLDTVPPAPTFWYSNRGDSVDDTLTLPPLDLRQTAHATLRYQIWYDLEQDYDYGYVEVSTDGGVTWYAQQTAHTTTSNPNGTNLGAGYTGTSCTTANRAQHCWLAEQVDLSAFAGKRILVRFEQVTDDEKNGQGLAVAHIQVPEVGFDGDTTAGGWHPAGWVRAINTLDEHWIVQAMVYRPSGISVLPLPVDASGHGSLRVPAGSTRVVVAVSPVAPLTTMPTSYTLAAGG